MLHSEYTLVKKSELRYNDSHAHTHSCHTYIALQTSRLWRDIHAQLRLTDPRESVWRDIHTQLQLPDPRDAPADHDAASAPSESKVQNEAEDDDQEDCSHQRQALRYWPIAT